ncbi:hypothetical protein [Oleiharenicola lentus]|uniref:hypothetical protein n=1 Tax=Oleiharenicola lentus TaxID=2508720 RepID=UPI0013E92CA3|nr:hypothetical protein [Oleiharenicola lentus]
MTLLIKSSLSQIFIIFASGGHFVFMVKSCCGSAVFGMETANVDSMDSLKVTPQTR